MNQPVPPKNNQPLQAAPGIEQQVENSILGGMQSAQGDNNILAQQTVTEAEYAATSGTGNATIYIYNYYGYREEVRVAPAKSADDFLCPYRGLFHFGPNDAEFFFGREVFVKELVQATTTCNFITVLGASGSGKSSVVFAGLVPKLQKEGHWKFTYFRPGSNPFHALAEALVPLYTPSLDATDQIAHARKLAKFLSDDEVFLSDVISKIQQNHINHRVLLIADQFEELYTLCGNEAICRRFLNCLLACIQSSTNKSPSPMVLVATLRADFLGIALSYPPFADVLRNTDVKIRSMNQEELKEVIEKPALKLGVEFEGGLVERILNDIKDEPGNLPMLEFALTLLWEKRTSKQLTHAAYEAIGEVQGALASYANTIYDKLNAAEQQQVQRIFIQLVNPSDSTDDTRRLATKAELNEASWSLVKQLADARLVVTNWNAANEETVEIAHEALIQNWRKLRQWMENYRSFRKWQEWLRSEMRQWETAGKDEELLLKGMPLAEAKNRLQQRSDMISPAEQNFIQLSLRVQQSRRIWGFILVGAVSVSILSAVGFWLWAELQGKTAKSLQLANASETNLSIDTTRSLWLAIAAKLTQDTPQADLALLNALQGNHERFQLIGHKKEVVYAEFDPRDSKRVLTVSNDHTVRIWDLDNLANPQILTGHKDTVKYGCFDPQNSNRILTVSFDGTARIWNLDNPSEPIILKGHEGPVYYGSFDPKNSNRVLTVSSDGTARIWNLNNPSNPLILKGHEGEVWRGSFDPKNSNRVLTVSSDSTARIWNLTQLDKPLVLKGHTGQVVYGNFDPLNSNRVVTVSSDRTARVWNLDTPTKSTVLQGHLDTVNYASFHPQDPNQVLTFSDDGTARLWNLNTPGQHQILRGHQGKILYGMFNPKDANQILTVSTDGTARIWNLQTLTLMFTLRGHSKKISFGTFNPKDPSKILTASDDATARIWDIRNNSFMQIPSNNTIHSTFTTENSNQLLTLSRDGRVKKWNINNLKDNENLPIEMGSIKDGLFAPSDSNRIATISLNNQIFIWNLQKPYKPLEILRSNREIYKLQFDPKNANRFLSINSNNTATVWDISNQTSIELKSLNQMSAGQFDPNDPNRVATASVDGTVYIWSLKKSTETLKPLFQFRGSQQEIWNLSFDPKQSNQIMTMGTDGIARIWNLNSRSIITELSGHEKAIVDGGFDPNDSNRIVTVSHDRTVRVWDLKISNESLIFRDHTEKIIRGYFDLYNANRILTVDINGQVYIYNLNSKEILRIAWNNLSRCLTSQEINNYNLVDLNLLELLSNYFHKSSRLLLQQKSRQNCSQYLHNSHEK